MELKSWLDLMAGVATQEQRRSLAEGGLSAAREILLGLQAKNVQLVNSNLELKVAKLIHSIQFTYLSPPSQ